MTAVPPAVVESEYSYEEYYGTEGGPSVLNYSASADVIPVDEVISISEHQKSVERQENFPSSDFKPLTESKASPDVRLAIIEDFSDPKSDIDKVKEVSLPT